MAPKRNKFKAKKSGSKTSTSKLANKRTTKTGNKIKRQQKTAKTERRKKRALKADQEVTHSNLREKSVPTSSVCIPLEDEDVAYYSTPGQNTSFASTVQVGLLSTDDVSNRKGKKRRRDDTDNEEEYEHLPRKLFTPDKSMKMMLPIKTKTGIVPQLVEEEVDEESEDEDHTSTPHDQEPEEPAESEPLPELSNVELYALRQRKLAERKQRIAVLSSAIIENPEEHVKKLRDLVMMLHEKDADVYVTVRKYVMVSLLEIFKDIIPGYSIRMPTDKEQHQKMKKETISLLSHEQSLVRSYQQYLEFLEKTAQGARKKKKKKDGEEDQLLTVPKSAQQSLTELAVRCLCELLIKHPHFNYTNNIITVIVPYMASKNEKVSNTACECVKTAFKDDKSGAVTLEITKCVGKLVKARNFILDPKVLETFLSLRIKEVSYTDPLGQENSKPSNKKTNFEKLSRKEKKRKKREMFYEKDLQETKATEDKKRRLRLHTETIQAVFVTYFRILKKATRSILLPTVLEGLARFAHLINVDFFDDLFTVFNKLIVSEELAYRESLHCVQTAFTILTGQGSVLNIDPMVFYRHMYKNLFHVHAGCTSDDIPIVLRCLDIMISQRKRQIPQQRVLAYTKRLAMMALQQTWSGSAALLAAIRSFMLTYKYTDSLLDNETQGSGVYLPELDDPEHCNAHNTMMWELTYLQHHYDPKVRRLAAHLSRGAPITGEGQLPVELKRQPLQLFDDLDSAEIFPDSIPEKQPKSKHKTVIEVLRNTEPTVLPTVNALITARVTNVNPRFCRCDIMKVGNIRMRETFRGMISMANVSSLKGVRTRYRNTLDRETTNARSIMESDFARRDKDTCLQDSKKSMKLLKLYTTKLEEHMVKISDAIGDSDMEFVEKVVNDDSELILGAEQCSIELELFIDALVKQETEVKEGMETKTELSESVRMLEVQQQMQNMLLMQMEKQKEYFEKLDKKEREVNSVKLPKLDMASFNGDKLRWVTFWDTFECTIHINKKLSNIEKFSYLQSKLYGEARRAVDGLALTNENYGVAIGILKERFGNKQEVVDLHYQKLINIPAPSARVDSLRLFLDSVERHIRSLEVLEENVNQHVFISMIRSKLPEFVLRQLEFHNGSWNEWTVYSLRDKLREYITACEKAMKTDNSENRELPPQNKGRTNMNRNQLSGRLNHSTPNNRQRYENTTKQLSAEALTANVKQKESFKNKCRYCGAKHWSDECVKYKSVEERKRELRGSCYKCLKEGHGARDCKSQKSCIHCGDFNNHHRSLCPKRFGVKSSLSHLSEEVSIEPSSAKGDIPDGHVLVSSDEMVLMQTARTQVGNPDGLARKQVRILFDSGSQRTYITEKLANELHLKPTLEQELKIVTFGSERPKVIKTKATQLCVTLKDGSIMEISANIVPTISGQTQRNPVKHLLSEQVKHVINSVDLADSIPGVKESSTIEVLVGNDYYMELILPQRIELDPGLYLLSSKLGWILTGRVSELTKSASETSMFVMTYGSDVTRESAFTSVDHVIPTKPDLEDFWNIESIGITDKLTKTSDEIALQKFQETLIFADGRYQVTWPWKEEEFNLPENRTLALGRLRSTVSRLSKNEQLMEKYNAVIKDQLDKGVIEETSRHQADGIRHYIPHHAVITPQKTTTKLRVVYDASAKSREGNKSLNDCLYRGPVILQDLCGMLMRFRLYKVAIVADIEKAFLQVGLQKDQRDVTRFLWLKDITKPVSPENIQEYRFTRVPFGMISSPFLLGAAVQSHLATYKIDLTEKIKNDIYVDNVITGEESDGKAIEFYDGAKSVFKDASMNLREWMTNDRVVNTYIPEFDRAKEESTGVLGLCWNTRDDTISLKSTDIIGNNEKATKRIVLKEVASNFDPLGLFSPVLLSGKLLIQRLWAKNLDWDDEVSIDDQLQWVKIRSDIRTLCEQNISRLVSVKGISGKVIYSLCCFCDASEKAYATAVYLKVTNGEEIKVELIFSKSRLAPLKSMTIPKLEIMAVLIGVRCIKFVEKQLRVPIETIHLFTDSQCCLHWINTEKDLPVFVKNRVNEIKEHNNVKFSYVKSMENPADVASRGTTVKNLVSSELWWHGPKWLYQSRNNWPLCTQEFLDMEDALSANDTVRNVTEDVHCQKESIAQMPQSAPFEIDHQDYSSVSKLLRVTAYVLRFIWIIRKRVPVKHGSLTSTELNKAELLWLKHIQHKHYEEVLKSVRINNRNNTVRQLNLFIGDSGLLRCRGRLQNATLTEGSRFPILLPKKDRFTVLVIEKHHKQLLHSGESQTLSHIRYKYWIPQGRAIVKSVLRQCRVCRRNEGGPYPVPQMPPLPNSRVTESPPFAHTGLDYLGPLYVKMAPETQKVWVCLFTCLVTRAIHLELVLDMTAKEFLLAFRRFISQRGVPSEIISDNALQFKTANRTLDLVWKNVCTDDDVQSYVSEKRIHWNFIVELAPWMGGFYERLVGIVKRSMRKAIGRKLMTLIQLQTFLKETEAVVNSRPLVYVGEDINSNISLTPGHFLTINPRVSAPDIDEDDKDVTYMPSQSTAENLLKMWHKGQKLLNAFWKLWVDDYLLSLRERTQTSLKRRRIEAKCTPNLGDVVHVKEDLPRSCWKLGRIQSLKQSRDKVVRSAEVRLSSGRLIKRPLNLLFPLEVTEHTRDIIQPKSNKPMNERPERAAAKVARCKIYNQLS